VLQELTLPLKEDGWSSLMYMVLPTEAWKDRAELTFPIDDQIFWISSNNTIYRGPNAISIQTAFEINVTGIITSLSRICK
jgi:hypothetical protein